MTQVYRSAQPGFSLMGRLTRKTGARAEGKTRETFSNPANEKREELQRDVQRYLLTAGGYRIV